MEVLQAIYEHLEEKIHNTHMLRWIISLSNTPTHIIVESRKSMTSKRFPVRYEIFIDKDKIFITNNVPSLDHAGIWVSLYDHGFLEHIIDEIMRGEKW